MKKMVFLLLTLTLFFMGCVESCTNPESDGIPILISPKNGAKLEITQNLNFSWKATENVFTYILHYRIDTGPHQEVEFTGDKTSFLIDASEFPTYGFNIGTTVTWSVKAQSLVSQMESETRTFEIIKNNK